MTGGFLFLWGEQQSVFIWEQRYQECRHKRKTASREPLAQGTGDTQKEQGADLQPRLSDYGEKENS